MAWVKSELKAERVCIGVREWSNLVSGHRDGQPDHSSAWPMPYLSRFLLGLPWSVTWNLGYIHPALTPVQPNSGGISAPTTIPKWWRQKPINHVSPFHPLGGQFWDTIHKAFRGSQSQMPINHCAGQLNHASCCLFLLPYFILLSYTYYSPKSQS